MSPLLHHQFPGFRARMGVSRWDITPGLGIEINEAEVKKHPFQQEVLQRTFHADGSVGDW